MTDIDVKSTEDLLKTFPDEQTCINHLEQLRWNGCVISPFDPTSKVYKCKGNKYKCKNTGKYFNVRSGSLFDNTKIELQKWFLAIYIVTSHKNGISSVQLSKEISVTQKTAWFMLQRIRNCFGISNDLELNDDEVKVDESFVDSENNKKQQNKQLEGVQCKSSKDKPPVICKIQKKEVLAAQQVMDAISGILPQEIIKIVKEAFNSNEKWLGHRQLQRVYNYKIVKLNLSEFKTNSVDVNTLEGFWTTIKKGIVEVYHFTSKKHLHMYLDEFVFRCNSRNVSEADRFMMGLRKLNYPLTYKELVK